MKACSICIELKKPIKKFNYSNFRKNYYKKFYNEFTRLISVICGYYDKGDYILYAAEVEPSELIPFLERDDLRYCAICYLKCKHCGRILELGVCVRGDPLIKFVREKDIRVNNFYEKKGCYFDNYIPKDYKQDYKRDMWIDNLKYSLGGGFLFGPLFFLLMGFKEGHTLRLFVVSMIGGVAWGLAMAIILIIVFSFPLNTKKLHDKKLDAYEKTIAEKFNVKYIGATIVDKVLRMSYIYFFEDYLLITRLHYRKVLEIKIYYSDIKEVYTFGTQHARIILHNKEEIEAILLSDNDFASFNGDIIRGKSKEQLTNTNNNDDISLNNKRKVALSHYNNKEYDKSLAFFEEIAFKKNDVESWFNVLISLMSSNKIKEGKEVFNRILKIHKGLNAQQPRELAIPFIRYYYACGLCDAGLYNDSLEQLEILKKIYMELKITDDTFVHIRGVPFLSQTLDLAKKVFYGLKISLSNSDFLKDLKRKIDDEGNKLIESYLVDEELSSF